MFKKFITLMSVTLLFSSCLAMRNLDIANVDDPSNLENSENILIEAGMSACESNLDCSFNEFCDLDTLYCSKNSTLYLLQAKKLFEDKFAQVMSDGNYAFGFKDGNSFNFGVEDLSIVFDDLSISSPKNAFELSIKALETSNSNKGPDFLINPLFIINPEKKSSCDNSKTIKLKEIYTLAAEILPYELRKADYPSLPFTTLIRKVVYNTKQNFTTYCDTTRERAALGTFTCRVAKGAKITILEKDRKYLIENSDLDINLEIELFGKNAIIRFKSDYSACLNDFIKESEYKEYRSQDLIAAFKVVGTISK